MNNTANASNDPTAEPERHKILEMLANGKINSDQAAALLGTLGTASRPGSTPPSGSAARWLRVRVTNNFTGRPKATVNLPFGLVDWGLKMGARYAPEMEGIDLEELRSYLTSTTEGKIVDVLDEERGDHVEVFLD